MRFNVLKIQTSSMPGMLLTANFFSELSNFLSSVVAVLCSTFRFLRAVPCQMGGEKAQSYNYINMNYIHINYKMCSVYVHAYVHSRTSITFECSRGYKRDLHVNMDGWTHKTFLVKNWQKIRGRPTNRWLDNIIDWTRLSIDNLR